MAQRATSLGPKPSLFFCFCFFLVFCCLVFFGGFKGQVRWPKGPPHLALNPPYFVFVFVFFCFCFFFFAFLSLFLIDKKNCFPLKKGHFCLFFSVSHCFSLAFFGPPPILPFLFLCLSLVLFFRPSFLFFIFSFWFLLFLFVVFAFLFQDVLLFLFFSACCLVLFLNHNMSFLFALHLVFWFLLFFCSSCFAILLFFDFWKPVKNISEKNGNWKNSKNEKCRKKNGHFDKSC